MSSKSNLFQLSPSEIQAKLQQLSTAAQTLNELSDQLTKEVSEVESALNHFNLGIAANVEVECRNHDDEGSVTTTWQLAYGKTGARWGFLIERIHENANWPDAYSYETWVFKDSPREQRVKAVEKIPFLLEALVRKSSEFASVMAKKVSYAQQLAETFSQRKLSGPEK